MIHKEQKHALEKFISQLNKTISQLEALKKKLRKEAFTNGGDTEKGKSFISALVLLVSKKTKQEKYWKQFTTAAHQKNHFHQNKLKFSQSKVNDTLSKEEVQKSFTKLSFDTFHPQTYSSSRTINLPGLHWFPPLLPSPDTDGFVPFQNSPIKHRNIKKVLSKANKSSAPYPDGVSYGGLLKLESTHHILTTLYNKVQSIGNAPPHGVGVLSN